MGGQELEVYSKVLSEWLPAKVTSLDPDGGCHLSYSFSKTVPKRSLQANVQNYTGKVGEDVKVWMDKLKSWCDGKVATIDEDGVDIDCSNMNRRVGKEHFKDTLRTFD